MMKPAPAVHSVHHFSFSVPDLAEAARFYEAFGLDVHAAKDRLLLHTHGHPHPWGSVHAGVGPKTLRYVTLGIYAHDEQHFKRIVEQLGTGCDPHPLSDGQGIWLRDPDGIPLGLVVSDKVSPSSKSVRKQAAVVPLGAGAAPARSRAEKVRPRYLSHILRFTPDVDRMLAFCGSVLGLRLSDRSGDIIAFVHTPHGSDHHLIAFAKSHAPGLHHSSWDVGSIDEVGSGAEQMRAAGWPDGWGMGRHVLGSNYFHYVRDPWGSFCEYSFDIDYVPAGFRWPAADHPPEDSLYVWGPPVPEDFVRNNERPAT